MPKDHTARRRLWPLAALILLGGGFRFFRLDGQSLWIDEFLMIQRASLGEPFRLADWFINPQGPLPALLIRLSTAALGFSEWALRLPSAVAGCLTIPAVHYLSRRLGGGSGWSAAALTALSPFLVWYSQETRHYALAILAAAWSASAFLALLDEGPSRGRLISLSLSLWVGVMSHLAMVFAAAAQVATLLLWRRDLLKAWLAAAIPVFLLTGPWIWVAVAQNLNLRHVIHPGPIPVGDMLRGESTFSWWGVPYTAFVFFAGYSLGPTLAELHASPDPAAVMPHLATILPLAAGAALACAQGLVALAGRPRRMSLVILWSAIPLAAVLLLAWRNARVFNPRYLAVALPLVLAVAGLGLEGAFRRSRWMGVVLGLGLLVPTLMSLGNYHFEARYAREDLRSAARLLSQTAAAEDVILGQGAPQPLTWYYRGRAPIIVVHEFDVRDAARLAARVSEWSRGRRRIWLVMSRVWLHDPEYRLKGLLDRLFGPGTDRRFHGVWLVEYDAQGSSP